MVVLEIIKKMLRLKSCTKFGGDWGGTKFSWVDTVCICAVKFTDGAFRIFLPFVGHESDTFGATCAIVPQFKP